MKILRVIQTMDPSFGGPVAGLKNSAAELARMGHETEVITMDPPDAPYLKDLPFPVEARGPMRIFMRYRYAPGIGTWIRANAHRFDGAIVHGLFDHCVIQGAQTLRQVGLPYLVFTHGMIDPWFRRTYPLKHAIKQVLWTLVIGRGLKGAHRVLFTSQNELKLALPEFIGHRYTPHVVPYGTAAVPDTPELRARQEAAFRAAVPGLGAAPYLVFLARMHAKKGVDLLLEAFLALADRLEGMHLVLAGPDPEGLIPALAEQARAAGLAERVHFPGMLQGDAKTGALRGADAFALISHSENFGIAVAEALACGTAVLTTDKVNIWTEIEAAGGGVIGPDTLEGAKDLLGRWAGMDAEAKAAMRAAALACYERHFSMPAAAQGLVEAFALPKPGAPKS